MDHKTKGFTVARRQGRLYLRFLDTQQECRVRPVWARPVRGRQAEIALLDEKQKEVVLTSLEAVDSASRSILEEELTRRYLIPQITRVTRTLVHFGNRYWSVETDRGPRQFHMKEPRKNVVWVSDDHLVLRDTLGNRYEIPSLSTLDARSQSLVERVM